MTELNPGIVETVKLLNSNGWITTDSGDGETHDFECDQDFGYVAIVLGEDQDLVQSCHKVYELLDRSLRHWDQTSVEGNYSPLDRYKIIYISHIHDRQLRD